MISDKSIDPSKSIHKLGSLPTDQKVAPLLKTTNTGHERALNIASTLLLKNADSPECERLFNLLPPGIKNDPYIMDLFERILKKQNPIRPE